MSEKIRYKITEDRDVELLDSEVYVEHGEKIRIRNGIMVAPDISDHIPHDDQLSRGFKRIRDGGGS